MLCMVCLVPSLAMKSLLPCLPIVFALIDQSAGLIMTFDIGSDHILMLAASQQVSAGVF